MNKRVAVIGAGPSGLAVLRANGYSPAIAPIFVSTGVASGIIGLFGGHLVNLAAITAALCAGPEAHPDPARRWVASASAGAAYVVLGLFAIVVIAGLHAAVTAADRMGQVLCAGVVAMVFTHVLVNVAMTGGRGRVAVPKGASVTLDPASKVLRVMVSNVRIPRSQKITLELPCDRTYSPDMSHSLIVPDMPRLSSTGLSVRPTSFRRLKFCMLRAPIWNTSA